jgi:hypothetical protein
MRGKLPAEWVIRPADNLHDRASRVAQEASRSAAAAVPGRLLSLRRRRLGNRSGYPAALRRGTGARKNTARRDQIVAHKACASICGLLSSTVIETHHCYHMHELRSMVGERDECRRWRPPRPAVGRSALVSCALDTSDAYRDGAPTRPALSDPTGVAHGHPPTTQPFLSRPAALCSRSKVDTR